MNNRINKDEVEEIIEFCTELRSDYLAMKNEEKKFLKQQNTFLIRILERMHREFVWLKQNNYNFANPHIPEHISTKGPVLGKSKEGSNIYVYDIESGCLVETARYDEFKQYPIQSLKIIEEGLFEIAMEGLVYAKGLLEERNNKINKRITDLKSQLKKYDEILND